MSRITLRAGPDADEDGRWSRDGLFGLERTDGYDQVGSIVSAEDTEVVRRFRPLSDDARQGDMVRVDSYAFPENPRKAFGLVVRGGHVFTSSLGEFPAWLVGGTEDTWVIMVHGRNAHRREALRMLPGVAELGLPALVINYRNDEGFPPDPSGYHRYGGTEWLDLEGAVKVCIGARGARSRSRGVQHGRRDRRQLPVRVGPVRCRERRHPGRPYAGFRRDGGPWREPPWLSRRALHSGQGLRRIPVRHRLGTPPTTSTVSMS